MATYGSVPEPPDAYPPGQYPQGQYPPPGSPARHGVDPGRLWAGGVAASLVAAGVAAVGYLFVRGVLGIHMLSAEPSGQVVEMSLVGYAFLAFVAGLVGTALAHVLVVTTPRPRVFFGWIIGLATAAAMLVPLSLDQPLESRLATAFVNLAIGITIGVLVSTAVAASRRRARPVYVPPPV
ncbi:DUF6069 family protein [Luedemannella helvata]|uniref:Integral membrane protein n=1 Tax=Luedemannella helvata TaxID=349315 RepID=A0ABP4W2H9_9ACTN